MKIETVNKVFFIGIGGIGMSALARYFLSKGATVSGYDLTPSSLTSKLEQEGASITFKDELAHIPQDFIQDENTLYIYTPAIPEENKLKKHLISLHKKLYKRAEILGLLSKSYECVGIAGTHGKTTISTITAHLFHQSPLACNAFLGGISKNYHSNLITSSQSKWMVVEADEFDRSFLQLHPQIALISAMDADHLDIYGHHDNLIQAFQQYAAQRKEKGKLVYKLHLASYFSEVSNTYSYDLSDIRADFHASNIRLIKHQFHFDLKHPKGLIKDLLMPMPGKINLENTVAACSTALLAGINGDDIRKALAGFLGIKRRMEKVFSTPFHYYDDYAHHPEEIKAAISSLQELYPTKEITVVFQPHLFSRTQDFAAEFAQSLSLAAKIILLDIYPAREKAISGVSSEIILQLIKTKNKQLLKKEALLSELKKQKPQVLFTLGAGDIDRLVEPIKQSFL
ncbi:MAG: UDP-N-acetylmuramate--L-alanine ligase [Bacteroidetes bacterium 4572_77]|nr:MAG: UDP-N-acetylmuramate--L-alanine ligase [Bacteroidetes bacterium 4572_77]